MAQGIEGHDILPQEIDDRIVQLFLPGHQRNALYNYDARASTQLGALQLDGLLHSGPHDWLNTGIKNVIAEIENLDPNNLPEPLASTCARTS